MRRGFSGSVVVSLFIWLAMCAGALPAAAQASSQPAHVAINGTQQHGVFAVKLANDIDSKKLKQGAPIEAFLVNSITLPSGATAARGAKVVGHVTEASAGSGSKLGIVFDKLVRGPGEETPIKGVVQAVAPNPDSAVSSGGNPVDYGVTMRSVMTAPPDMTKSQTPLLTEDSQGVLGFKNMKLGPDGVITSDAKEIKLERGTRLLLNATMQ